MSDTGENQERGTGAQFELRITIACADRDADVRVNAIPTETVADVAEAAADHVGERQTGALWCERRSRVLDGDTRLAQAGIRWGDRLRLAPKLGRPTRAGGTPAAELIVTGGPCAGERWELGTGSFRLGRNPDSDIRLSDRSLSGRHLELKVEQSVVSIADAGSSNGTAIDGRSLVPHEWHVLSDGDELELGRTLLRVRSFSEPGDRHIAEHDGRLEFNRPPRVNRADTPFKQEIAAPPARGRKLKLPLAASLAPIGVGVLLFVLLKSPVMLAIAGLSPVMAISSYVSDRRGGKKSFARGSADYRKRVAEVLTALDNALKTEAGVRREESPDAPTLIDRARTLAPTVWERRPANSDFLALRIGVADLEARARVELTAGGDEDLYAEAVGAFASRATVPAVPLVVELPRLVAVGVAGERQASAALARWMVVQAALLHSPGDLVVLAALGQDSVSEWSWLKWLPHLRPDRVGIETSPVAVGRPAAEELVAEVRALATRRGERRQAGEHEHQAHVLLLLDEAANVDRALVGAALSAAAGRGVSVIWLGQRRRDLPGQCGAIVELETGRSALALTEVASGSVVAGASADGLSVAIADEAARLLAPVRDVSETGRAGEIPNRVSLLELIDMVPPAPEEIEARWRAWRGDLRSEVGRSAEGTFTIDLRADGPHALIAGTTGSGKSEFLRSFVAAAAANAPPNRLSFLLVDYKGGSAFAPCAALPHVVDVVSDLDEHMAERALISLDAELKRRERILFESGAKDLQELQRKNPEGAPPLLVIAVDEFAKLRDEVPEFVDGVVDIAQRGRSLGVHMVLAAQTLRNAFTPAIRANTNLRIALRVAEETESEDMIANPSAARIPSGERSRGRGFARTGHGELREFQAAYVSGRTPGAEERRLELTEFELEEHIPPSGSSGGPGDSDDDNDLTALGDAARVAQERMGLRMPPPPWVPMLPTLLATSAIDRLDAGPSRVAIGLVDMPHLQRQDPLVIDLPQTGNVAVFGGGGSGKTTVLTTTALALANSAAPEDLVIYGLDAGSGGLAPLAALPHCAGIVSVADEERVDRLFRILLRRVEHRAADTARGRGTPMIVLLLDDLGAFAQQYDRPGFGLPFESLARVLSSGRAARVHVILTASRRGALPAALSAHIGQRLVLRMATEEELLSLGLDAKTVRGARLPVGRGFTQESLEFHVAVHVQDDAPAAIADIVATVPGDRAPGAASVDVLPTNVARASLPPSAALDSVMFALADEDMGPAAVDLSEMHLLVVGPYRSGRSTALATLALGVREADAGAELHLLAPRRSPLRDLDIWTSRSTTAEACTKTVVELGTRLEAGEVGSRPAFVFVDDGGELTDAMIVSHLERLVRRSRDGGLRVVAAVETSGARGMGLGWIRELRREGHGILLQPDLLSDGDILSARLPRRVAAPMTPGRGFLVSRGTAALVQIAS